MDINDQIAANVGLVYKQLHRFNLVYDQDAESLAYEALYKAILSYNADTGNALSTYATCVIANALRMHLRSKNKKRQLEVISYDEPIADCEDYYRVDTLRHADSTESLILNAELRDKIEEAKLIVLDGLTDTQRKVILLRYEADNPLTQREIAETLKVSQATVSKAISIFKYRLSKELEDYL